ncbi:MAG: putative sugar nucleotidyl transferase [Phycisphaerae bacterium]|nr:putative sugar nucleotidyl transferase [Phycisphaerae bacterium]
MPNAVPGLVLLDDGQGEFGPLCDLAPVFALRTGAITTRERIERALGLAVAAKVPASLEALVLETTGLASVLPQGDSFIVVNGRLAEASEALGLEPNDVVTSGGVVVAARLSRADVERFLASGELPRGTRSRPSSASLLVYPWDILNALGANITSDIAAMVPRAAALEYAMLPDPHASRMGTHPVLLHRTANVAPQVVFDASAGPVVVGPKCLIRPMSVVCGPCSIGEGSTISDRSLIKPNVTCGMQCRLGGEVGGTSIAGRSNKTHDGHLGDSVLGEWVNLGAGTDNSNLLNTYGEVPVRLESDGPRVRSGRIFFGAVIGDHVKCAIGTRIMTGSVLGTGAMIATSKPPPTTLRRFGWLTDEGERRYTLSKFIEVAKTVMARRGVTPGPAYLARLAALHATSGTDA